MKVLTKKLKYFFRVVIVIFAFMFVAVPCSFSDVYINILAVNGTDEKKEKDVKEYLPSELRSEDILDTGELSATYDATKGAYYVHGKISLDAKETKTIKVLVRDIWEFKPEDVAGIKEQIDASIVRLNGTEYYDYALIKKENLLKRLDFVVDEQNRTEDVGTRIDRFRVYSSEMERIRANSLSVKYWRAKLPDARDTNILKYNIEVENPFDGPITTEDRKYYLPTEVMPEHLVNLQDFQVRYDIEKGQSFLSKSEELKPKEIKKYEIGIIDVWNIEHSEIENLKLRAANVYKLLEPTEYLNSANYLMASIKKNLDGVETSQSQEKDIKEYISSYRSNLVAFDKAKNDVEALESLLEAVRENLERSKVKNVLKRVRSFKNVAEIAKHYDVTSTEMLAQYDGKRGFTLSQGE